VWLSAGMNASAGAPGYERHRPEKTLLYQLVEQYYPAFVTQLADEGKLLPDYVHQEFYADLIPDPASTVQKKSHPA